MTAGVDRLRGGDPEPEVTTYGDPGELAVFALSAGRPEATSALVPLSIDFEKTTLANQQQLNAWMPLGPKHIRLRLSRYNSVFPMYVLALDDPHCSLFTSPIPSQMTPARWLRRICELELEHHGRDLPFYLGFLLYVGLCSCPNVSDPLTALSMAFDHSHGKPIFPPASVTNAHSGGLSLNRMQFRTAKRAGGRLVGGGTAREHIVVGLADYQHRTPAPGGGAGVGCLSHSGSFCSSMGGLSGCGRYRFLKRRMTSTRRTS